MTLLSVASYHTAITGKPTESWSLRKLVIYS